MLKCKYCTRFTFGSRCYKDVKAQECVCDGDDTRCELYPEIKQSAIDRRQAELDRRVELEWFDFEKQKPVHGDEVLGIDTDGKVDVYQFSDEWPGCLMQYDGVIKVYNITHWTYLFKKPF